jgi:hypothetical protein
MANWREARDRAVQEGPSRHEPRLTYDSWCDALERQIGPLDAYAARKRQPATVPA